MHEAATPLKRFLQEGRVGEWARQNTLSSRTSFLAMRDFQRFKTNPEYTGFVELEGYHLIRRYKMSKIILFATFGVVAG